MNLYHVTPEKNTSSIQKVGVDPLFSKGKKPVSWWVEWEALLWAIAHVSDRHNVSVANIRVWAIDEEEMHRRKRTAWSGVYTIDYVAIPKYGYQAKDMVEALRPTDVLEDTDIPY